MDVDAFYGIEISEWPARIAEVAMWLMDHQMNIRLSEAFGQYFVRLPLKKSPTIVCGNALRLDWKKILPPEQCSYVLGNPPFVGKQFADRRAKGRHGPRLRQRQGRRRSRLRHRLVFQGGRVHSRHAISWSASFPPTPSPRASRSAFFGTSSFRRYRLKIHFAHRTFAWESEARGKAHVHVVIIGFGAFDTTQQAHLRLRRRRRATSLSPPPRTSAHILIEGSDMRRRDRRDARSATFPKSSSATSRTTADISFLTDLKRSELLDERTRAPRNSSARFVGAEEFINGDQRWCLWLRTLRQPNFAQMPEVMKRVEGCARISRRKQAPRPRENWRKRRRCSARFGSRNDRLPADPDGFVRDAPIHSHRLHARRSHRQQPCCSSFPTPRFTISAFSPRRCTWLGCGRSADD